MLPAPAKRIGPPKLKAIQWKAPGDGGINQVDVASQMPPEDCIYAYNLIRGQYGLQVRTGSKEWCTGLTGGLDNWVRTIIPYSGSAADGSKDKLFAVTAAAIYDCTNSGALTALNRVWTFQNAGGLSGYGQYAKFTTPGGHFLFYCDEVNGPFYYVESAGAWGQVGGEVPSAPWTGSTQVNVGDQVVNVGKAYQCAVSGITGTPNTGGPTTNAQGIVDGAAQWNYLGPANVGIGFFGPSLADQQGLYADQPNKFLTSNFVSVMAWKSRLWFVERNSTRAWYLPVNQVGGVLTSFDFGGKMQGGGALANLFDWTTTGAAGADIDSMLVAISTAGDVVIYQGTDPTSAATFGLKGAWQLKGVPFGRRIATDIGGDILVASMLGAVPLSRLIIGTPAIDRTQYATYKISPLFTQLAASYGNLPGWSMMLHPQDNALLVNVPQPFGYPALQLAMSLSTRRWSQYRYLPIVSGAVWQQQGQGKNGAQFFFGTPDGRVCVSQGGVDNVLLVNPASWSPIAWSYLSSYQTNGDPRQKIVRTIRPTILSQVGSTNLEAVAKFGYDISEPPDTSSVGAPSGATWDAALWDAATWQADLTPFSPVIGSAGMGREVAIALRGQAIAPLVIASIYVYYEPGGLF